MTSRAAFRFLVTLSVALPLFTAGAQTPYSPASPPNTSNPFAGVALPQAAPAQRNQGGQTSVQAGLPITSLSAVPGGYVANTQVMTSEPVDPNHKLGRGDRMSYRVAEDREPDKTYQLIVADSGEVDLPIGGRIKAAGKTTEQLRADIKSMLDRDYYYNATIYMGLDAVAQRSRGTVYVIGAVRSVGPVELPADAPLTASQAIYKMGGPVDFSNLKRTRVLRKGGPKDGIPVNVKAVEKGEFEKDVVLQPGDTVNVPVAGIGIKF